MMVYLSDKKKEKLKFLCTQALDGDILSIRFVARVTGKIVSSLPGSEFGKLYYRNLERNKIRALALNRGDYDAKMQLSVLGKKDLLWWVENVQQAYRRIIHAAITYVFQTDASDTGWGISCSSHDSWKLSDVHIQFELDNVTAVAYVNQMGGSKSIACDLLAHKIWSWCIARSIWVSAVHILGCTNVEPDLFSRNCYSDHEWQLNRVIFQKLWAVFPALSIDLFASVLNAQLPRFVSWNPDPHARFVDAFSISWTGEYFYAFPPFCLIHKCLTKTDAEQAERVFFGGTSLDHTDMVPTSIAAVNPSSQTHVVDCGNGACSSSVSPQSSHHEGEAKIIDSMSFIRRHYEERGFSEHVTNVLLDSWGPSTQKQYAVYLREWAAFCRERQITANSHTLMDVLEFLHTQLHLSARSALSCVISIDNVPVGQHPLVCRFVKGAFERKPPSRKYYAIWDVRQVLNFLKL